MNFLPKGLHTGLVVFVVILFNVIAIAYFSIDVSNDLAKRRIQQVSEEVNGPNDDLTTCIRIENLEPDEVPGNQSIFFIETSRRTAVQFTTRQACSVESAARINPDRLVFVLFLSSTFDCRNDVTAIFSLVSNYPNVRLRHIDLYNYVKDTPMEDFVRTGVMEKGRWLVEQHSDMLRILTLWKFGGVYMDLDVVSLKPMHFTNFIGAEYPEVNLASCVIGMQNKDVAEKAIEMFTEGWDGENWAKNGPQLLTNLMAELCNTRHVKLMYKANCNNFIIYRPDVFGPIAWYNWPIFFDPLSLQTVKESINKSIAVHFWNKLSKEATIFAKSNQPYAYIAKEFCPKVFNTVNDTF